MNSNYKRRRKVLRTQTSCLAHYSELEPRKMLAFSMGAMVEFASATSGDDSILIQLDPLDSNIVEFNVNGVVTNQIDLTTSDQIIFDGLEGNDSIVIDYSNGDPTPQQGFVINGGEGVDSLIITTDENVEFLLNGLDAFAPVTDLVDQIDGAFSLLTSGGVAIADGSVICSQFLDFENLNSTGSGDDLLLIPNDSTIAEYAGDFSIDLGLGQNQIRIFEQGSGLELVVQQDNIEGLFDGTFYYEATGGTFALGSEIDLGNRFAGIEIEGSNTESDRITVGSFLEFNSIAISGRGGTDHLTVGDINDELVRGEVLLGGNAGNDVFRLLFLDVDSEQIGVFAGSSFFDTVQTFGHVGSDNIDIDRSGLYFSTPENADGMPLSSRYRILANGTLEVSTFSGNDTVNINGSQLRNTIVGTHSDNNLVNVEATTAITNLQIWTGDSNSNTKVEFNNSASNTEILVGGDNGNDNVIVSAGSTADLELRSPDIVDIFGVGSRRRKTEIAGTLNELNVFASGERRTYELRDLFYEVDKEEIDLLDVTTEFDAVLDSGLESGAQNDFFKIYSATSANSLTLMGRGGFDIYEFRATSGSDRFTADISVMDEYGVNNITFRGRHDNPVNVEVTNEQVIGYTDGAFSYSGEGPFSSGTFKFVLGGSDFDDHFIGGTTIVGYDGDDIFDITNPNFDLLDGRSGNDIYNIPEFPTPFFTTPRIVDIGFSGRDVINLAARSGRYYVEENTILNDEDITLGLFTNTESELNFSTGSENDTVIISGSPSETLRIETNNGNDVLRVAGNDGLDHLTLLGGEGNDFFDFNFSADELFVEAFGSAGNDFFELGRLASGNIRIDGQEGSDKQKIYATGSRIIDARDTGIDGNDSTEIIGRFFDDEFVIDEEQILFLQEQITLDDNTEHLNLLTGEGDDHVTIRNPSAQSIEVRTVDGDDSVFIEDHAIDLIVRTSQGADQIVVQGTQAGSSTYLRSGGGDDTFRFGSANTGNLSNFQGEITVFAGGHSEFGDRVLINDRISNGNYGYHVSPTRIEALSGDGILSRPEFAGINLSGKTELIRLEGTIQANQFEVVASELTRYTIVGDDPANDSFLVDALTVLIEEEDLAEFFLTDIDAGNGFANFEGDKMPVLFFEIEDREFDVFD